MFNFRPFMNAGRAALRCTATIASLLLFFSPAESQVLYGSITGNVRDPNGASIAGATVTITNNQTGLSRDAVTDESGNYTFATVPTGNYTVKVNHAGFKTFTRTDVPVTINNVTRVDITMEVGTVTETVTVTTDTPQLQTDTAEVKGELNNRALENLPVPLGRNYQHLFATLPGFMITGEPHSVGSNPSRSLQFHVNGASSSINNTRIDGASATNIWLPHITAYVPALESIQVVNVVTNSFDAEQGLAGGAAINVQIKSGTNDFHGSAFEYHTNQHLSAKPYRFRGPERDKPKLVYNQFGGTLGGPIKRDKLFFFVSYEGTFDRRNVQRDNFSVPTAKVRSGDFRDLVVNGQPVVIYDPATGNADGSGRQIISCNGVQNVICPERINPISRKILSLLPLPNQPGEFNNYFASGSQVFDRHTIDSKVNWNITESFNMFGRFSMLDFQVDNPVAFGPQIEGPRIDGRANAGAGFGKTYVFSLGGAYTFNPNFVIDGVFGFVRMNTNNEYPSIGKNYGLDLLGIPGTNGTEKFESGFPRFSISGYSVIGVEENYMPYFRSDDQYQYVVNFNYLHGNHSIRWGADIYQQNMNHVQPEFIVGTSYGSRGGFDFGGGPTALRGGTNPNAYNALASFLLGLTTQFGKLELNEFPITTRATLYSFYVRDQWKVTPRLTLSFGTRWEYFPIPRRATRGMERYDPETNRMLIGGVGQVPLDLGVKVSKTEFAPRIGVAYRPTEKMVIRAGFGVTNDPYSLARPLRTNHPLLSNLVVPAPNSFGWAGRIEQGIPSVPYPGLDDGIVPVPGNVAVYTLGNEFKRGYIKSFNLFIERQLWKGFVGEIGYVGTRQIDQLGYRELNYPQLGGGTASRALNRKFGRTAETLLVTPIGNSSYDALQASLNRRFANGFELRANYTFSKAIGYAPNSDNTLLINIPEFYSLNKRLQDFDRTHVINITNILELPFGKGRRWLSNGGVAATLLGGWQLNSIIRFGSGTPFSVTGPGTGINAPGNTQRADLIKSKVEIYGRTGPGQPYFDTSAFRAVPSNEVRFGTAGFNILRGPGFFRWDFGVFRRLPLSERVDLQLRADAINLTNTPVFANPDGSITSTNFGSITGTSGLHYPRFFRLGLRLGF